VLAFRAQARRVPDRIAVSYGDATLTYAGLERRSDALADALAERGIGPEQRVGVLLERSLDWLTAVLGILKSGAAYVPLDSTWPAARVQAVARDAGLAALVIDTGAVPLPADLPCMAVEAAGTPTSRRRRAPTAGAGALSLAYVIYTSGSTGGPKGVMVEHRALANLAPALRRALYADLAPEGLRIGVNGPLAFDTSVKQLVQLAFGHTLCIMPELARRDPRECEAFLSRAALDVLDCTPSLLDAWLADGVEHLPPTLLVGGEAVSPALWTRLRAGPGAAHNLYGPTECTVDATTCPIDGARTWPRLGRALDGVRVHVVDASLRETGGAEPGEIAIAGRGLGRGYHAQPRATAARFVPNPWPRHVGERLYLTGDRGRVLSDGELEFLGRADRQIKLRGARIELGELEAALLQHPSVRAAVAVQRPMGGSPALVGYVVSSERQACDPRALRAWLRGQLPEAMVPSEIVCLDVLPTTPNGKVDLAALPNPAELRALIPESERPRTATERAVADVWCEVLGRAAVGVHERFSDLGGHSLSAGRVVARLRAVLGRELPLRWLFERDTIAALASSLDAGTAPLPVLAPLSPGRRASGVVSFAQERVLFLHTLAPDSVAYLCRSALSFEGLLDVDCLRRALQAIVQRHEILRTAFVEERGCWRQEVQPAWEVRLEPIELPGADLEDEAWRGFLRARAREGFELARPPLVRWTLVRRGPRRHVLVCVAHHLVHDGWSSSVFFSELCALYSGFMDGQPAELPALPVQMVDFCAWQRAFLKSDDAQRQLSHWSARLADPPPSLELPLDHPRPLHARFQGAVLRCELDAALEGALREVGRVSGATVFMVMLAAFAALVARQAGQDDFCIGSFVANRRHRETEPLIGMILNTLPVRVRLRGVRDVRALVAHVREVLLDAYANQDVPFDALVESVQPARSAARNPLFQVAFTAHAAPSDLHVPGARLTLEDFIDNGSSKFDLSVVMIPRAAGVALVWEYDSDLFEARTVRGWMQAYMEILRTVAADSRQRLERLLAATESEARVLDVANDTAAPLDEPVDVLFDRQAARTPDALAVTGCDGARSYEGLRRASEQLARRLRAHGVVPGAVVAVCVRRSTRLPEALLAVLKAGAAYLPLDAEHPPARLRAMLEDAGVALVLVDASRRARLTDCGVALLDVEGGHDIEGSSRAFARRPHPRDLAYVVYTSGSTGKPKGVAVFHEALTNVVLSMASLAGIAAGTRLFALSNVAFDIAALELFAPLVTGGTCCLASEQLGTSEVVFEELAATDADVVQATPSGWRILLQQGLDLRRTTVLVGGEALPSELAAGLGARAAAVWNCYGPSETTVWSTIHRLGSDRHPAIGRPLANTRTYVLDERGGRRAPGAVGELVIGGAGVAAGYVDRARATAGAFVPDPWAAGQRLYRTGDFARQRADGTLEFLGRRDHQVKIRGQRIELGEIEAALDALPEVQAAVVRAREERAGTQLVAYLVPRGGAAPPDSSVRGLRERLRATLPEAMLPASVVWLASLPMTPNGKVDRTALPAPPEQPGSAPEAAPRTHVEVTLAAIWQQVLGRASVGVHDDFFGLGGHSLAAMQMAARAAEALGIEVPLHMVFERPVLGDLAAALDGPGAVALGSLFDQLHHIGSES
jgi:amino acid adenylation domain-containing protein